jgi:hypothetical protein
MKVESVAYYAGFDVLSTAGMSFKILWHATPYYLVEFCTCQNFRILLSCPKVGLACTQRLALHVVPQPIFSLTFIYSSPIEAQSIYILP